MRKGAALVGRCVVALAIVVGAVATAAPLYKVELVQVVHRHGARSALVDGNETEICGTEFPCGFLNVEGQVMLVNFGKFMHYRYMEDPTVVAAPYFPYDGYNLSISYTRSTDVLRTLQSANGLLQGLFPNASAFFPAIHTVDKKTDYLLRSDALPLIHSREEYAKQEVRDVCDPVIDSRMTFAELQATAAEVYSQKFCANYTLRSRCAERLCDIAHAYESTGQIDGLPLLRQHLDDVCAVTAMSSYYYFSYNMSNPVHQRQGAPYYHLTRLLTDNMKAHQQPATAPPYKLYEYSAHDTTISPLAASLGDSSLDAMLPPFGTAFIIELLSRTDAAAGASAASPAFYVRVLRGHPGVTPASNFTFALSPFTLRCTDAKGAMYAAADNVCPFADFERFVESTAPTSPMGTCYLDPGLLARMDCPLDAVGDPRPLSADCLAYRRFCGAYACGTGYYLSAIDYGCHRIPATETAPQKPAMSSGGIAALCIFLFFAGGAASLGGLEAWKRYRTSKWQQTEAVVVE